MSLRGVGLFFAVAGALLAGSVSAGEPSGGRTAPGTCLTDPEVELARRINDYRQSKDRPAIPVTKSLSLVARWHAIDLSENQQWMQGTDPRGLPCGLQSWSAKGPWKALCYTSDHHYAEAMWRKPQELTANAYLGNGFEIVYKTSGPLVVPRVVEYWTDRPEERDMILSSGVWQGLAWPVMGVGVVGNYAVLWFGDQPDRQGEISPCRPEVAGARP